MRLTIVGSGDAFGSGGRFNTCFWVETSKATLMLDCGASSPVALKRRGLEFGRVDADPAPAWRSFRRLGSCCSTSSSCRGARVRC
jgi:hypothetical protein